MRDVHERVGESECMDVWKRDRENVCAWVCMCEWKRESKGLWVIERNRNSQHVCVMEK